MIPTFDEGKVYYGDGATRSAGVLSLSLVPLEAVIGIARRLEYGAKRHGRENWKKGDIAFVQVTKDHLLNHVLMYIAEGRQEDLDAVGANFAFLEYFAARGIK